MSGTKDLLIKIADSYIDLNEISLDDQVLVDRGILSQSEMNEFKEKLQSKSNEIMDKLSVEESKKIATYQTSKKLKIALCN